MSEVEGSSFVNSLVFCPTNNTIPDTIGCCHGGERENKPAELKAACQAFSSEDCCFCLALAPGSFDDGYAGTCEALNFFEYDSLRISEFWNRFRLDTVRCLFFRLESPFHECEHVIARVVCTPGKGEIDVLVPGFADTVTGPLLISDYQTIPTGHPIGKDDRSHKVELGVVGWLVCAKRGECCLPSKAVDHRLNCRLLRFLPDRTEGRFVPAK